MWRPRRRLSRLSALHVNYCRLSKFILGTYAFGFAYFPPFSYRRTQPASQPISESSRHAYDSLTVWFKQHSSLNIQRSNQFLRVENVLPHDTTYVLLVVAKTQVKRKKTEMTPKVIDDMLGVLFCHSLSIITQSKQTAHWKQIKRFVWELKA